MGRPKVLRNRDVVKSVDTKKTGKHKSFEDSEDGAVEESVVEEVIQSVHSESQGDTPEEVKNDNEEILSLKRLHEQMIDPSKRKSKRKMVKVIEDADVELDTSVLNSLDEIHSSAENESAPSSSAVISGPGKIDKSKTNSKKFGNIVVSVLDEYVDPIANFKVQKSVLEFEAANNRHERIKYSTFTAQKKGKIAKSFFVK